MKKNFVIQKEFTGTLTLSDVEGDLSEGFYCPDNDGLLLYKELKKMKTGDKIKLTFT